MIACGQFGCFHRGKPRAIQKQKKALQINMMASVVIKVNWLCFWSIAMAIPCLSQNNIQLLLRSQMGKEKGIIYHWELGKSVKTRSWKLVINNSNILLLGPCWFNEEPGESWASEKSECLDNYPPVCHRGQQGLESWRSPLSSSKFSVIITNREKKQKHIILKWYFSNLLAPGTLYTLKNHWDQRTFCLFWQYLLIFIILETKSETFLSSY